MKDPKFWNEVYTRLVKTFRVRQSERKHFVEIATTNNYRENDLEFRLHDGPLHFSGKIRARINKKTGELDKLWLYVHPETLRGELRDQVVDFNRILEFRVMFGQWP